MMKTSKMLLTLMLALLLGLPLGVSAGDAAVDTRIGQAQAYRAEGRMDEALLALQLAMATDPGRIEPVLMRIEILLELGRVDEAQALIRDASAQWPNRHEPYLYAAGCALLQDDLDAAWVAMLTARVAIGDDRALAEALDEAGARHVEAVADALSIARRYAQAMELYAISAPGEGEDHHYRLALAMTGEPGAADVHPGITQEAFEAALASDRLRLVPAPVSFTLDWGQVYQEALRYIDAYAPYGGAALSEDTQETEGTQSLSGDALYELVSIVSLSPDGRKALVRLDNVPAILDFEHNTLRLLTPAEGLDETFVQRVMLAQAFLREDIGIVWSPSGRYAAISFYRQTLQQMHLGMNIVLIDIETGVMRPIVDMPFRVSFRDESFAGAPFRAVFDPVADNILYYELYGKPLGEKERVDEIRVYDIETGADTLLSQSGVDTATADPSLHATRAGLWYAYSGLNASEPAGVALSAFGGEGHRYPIDTALRQALRQPILRDVRGGSALAMYDASRLADAVEGLELPGGRILAPFALEGDISRGMAQAIYVMPDEAPAARLVRVDLAALLAAGTQAGEPYVREGACLPHNGVLSPDGRYLLLVAIQRSQNASCLYLLDMESGVCGEVGINLPEDIGAFQFCLYNSPVSGYTLGMTWVSGNRLLLRVGTDYRLYSFEIAPK